MRIEKKILVIGCARSGIAVAKYLVSKGEKVILTDNKDEKTIVNNFPEIKEIACSNIELIFGKQPDINILDGIKEIIISPGVPMNIPIIVEANNRKISIMGEVELAFKYLNAPVYAITGTNGKTTTTTLTGEIFKNSGKSTFVVGNIGDPIINYVNIADEKSIFVAEISSFQLETIDSFRPNIASILNITPDHLDRHKTMENYIEAKASIFKNQKEDDYLLLNLDDAIVRELSKKTKSKVIYFSVKEKVANGAYLDDKCIIISKENKTYSVCNVDELKIKGIHNVKNALAATAIAFFGGVSVEVIAKTLKNFKGVEHRLEAVDTFNGIEFINDSKGTNTDAATIAINAMLKPIVLIAGGYDKGTKFDKFIESFHGKVKHMIILGQTAQTIEKAAINNDFRSFTKVSSFEEAINKAYEIADKGDVILLSPACASWDMFKDFEQRGRIFKELVRNLRRQK